MMELPRRHATPLKARGGPARTHWHSLVGRSGSAGHTVPELAARATRGCGPPGSVVRNGTQAADDVGARIFGIGQLRGRLGGDGDRPGGLNRSDGTGRAFTRAYISESPYGALQVVQTGSAGPEGPGRGRGWKSLCAEVGPFHWQHQPVTVRCHGARRAQDTSEAHSSLKVQVGHLPGPGASGLQATSAGPAAYQSR
jgi:hypothetical protein